MQEQWEIWKPLQNLEKEYEIEQVHNGKDGFKIFLYDVHDENNKIAVIFQDSVWAYRYTYESFRQKIIENLDNKYGTEFYKNRTFFFKVINSEYLEWLSDQSYSLTDRLSLIHFAILTAEYIIDIIANYEPVVEFVKEYE